MTKDSNPLSRWGRGLSNTLSLIKFSHTIFALPFALASMLIAAKGFPHLRTFLLILVCMVTGRTTGMAFNRTIDAELDAKNPRTANREIPKGILSRRFTLGLALSSSLLFLLSAYALNPLCFYLSPLALFLLFFYSFTKRWTSLSHLFIGLALGISPIGAWIAVTGSWDWKPFLLGLGVLFWVAGFDVIYATQDEAFDRKEGLHSLVVRLGLSKALLVSRGFHLLTLLLFGLFGFLIEGGLSYWLALALCTLFLFYEHHLVRPTDLSRVNAAFFSMNGYLAIVYLAGVVVTVF